MNNNENIPSLEDTVTDVLSGLYTNQPDTFQSLIDKFIEIGLPNPISIEEVAKLCAMQE